jgi:hypothetical protein
MSYLDSLFEEMNHTLRSKRRLNYMGVDPVFYLVFPPKEVLLVKSRMFQWKSKLVNDGFQPTELSMTDLISEIIQNHHLYQACLDSEVDDPFQFKDINQSIKDILLENKPINEKIIKTINNLPENGILLITDIESLHPYFHMSSIESELQGMIHKPIVIFYPGKRTGDSNLSFLGIHPEMGNYRSTHIGGRE